MSHRWWWVFFNRRHDGLLALLPNLDTGRFAQVMQQALAVAGVAGMSDADDDSDA